MADIIGLNDVSTKDTGAGSKLKTGGRRSHNMPSKKRCSKLKGRAKEDCLNYRGKFAKAFGKKSKNKVLPEQYMISNKPPFFGISPAGTGQGKEIKKRRKKWQDQFEKYGR